MATSTNITIDVDGQNHLTVTPKVHTMKTTDDVTWVLGAGLPVGTPFVVCFLPQSPFNDIHFSNSHANSGNPTVKPNHNKKYKYTVEIPGQSLDPDVIVDT